MLLPGKTERLNLPFVSIGMPVYNGADVIEQAIESVLSQSFRDFELIISDNASTDRTEEICRRYAAEDPRVCYVRQPQNIGAEKNFLFVIESARATFFMWAAADDIRCPEFVEKNYEFLLAHGDFVASTMPTRFAGGHFDPRKIGDRPLDSDSPAERVADFFSGWHANGLFYSLFRIEVLRSCPWLGVSFLGADWAVVLYLASRGKLGRLTCGWVELGRHGVSNSGTIYRRYRHSWIDLVFPFRAMTKVAWVISSDFPPRTRIGILNSCLKMNCWAMINQMIGALYCHYKLLIGRSSV